MNSEHSPVGAGSTANRRATRSTGEYRHDGKYFVVEMTLSDSRQLFNSLDPAPFREKDLDAAAEEYIEGAIREIRQSHPVRLEVDLPKSGLGAESPESIASAIRHYFDYRAHRASAELKSTFARGAVALAIALVFLFACLWVRALMSSSGHEIFMEGLLILGWVAMWRPIEGFLYDWWPIRHRLRSYRRIAAMPIDVQVRNT